MSQTINDSVTEISLLDRRRHRDDPMGTFDIVNGLSGPRPDGFCHKDVDSRACGHERKVAKPRPGLLVGPDFFGNRVVNIWNRLSVNLITMQNVGPFKTV